MKTAFGIDGQRVFLEFAQPGTGRRVHAELDEDGRFARSESGDEGRGFAEYRRRPVVRLLVRRGSVFDEAGAEQFVDERLLSFCEPLRALEAALPQDFETGQPASWQPTIEIL